MVLDGVEEKHRGRLKAIWEQSKEEMVAGEVPLWAQEREWGNDGLVTVQSAKWGEFLGIMEGCDHWEMRGARGIEFGVDLPAIPAIGLGGSMAGHRNPNTTGENSWGLEGLGRLVKPWKKEEKSQQEKATTTVNPGTPQDRERERQQRRERDDAVVKSSTDRLSAVLDWLTEQVPSPPLFGVKGKNNVRVWEGRAQDHEGPGKEKRKNELATKADLQRFYVGLSRKLYDEGL